jgi:hypothetical protein
MQEKMSRNKNMTKMFSFICIAVDALLQFIHRIQSEILFRKP